MAGGGRKKTFSQLVVVTWHVVGHLSVFIGQIIVFIAQLNIFMADMIHH